MIKVGLTGGIGSGKTTVAKFFRELSVPIYVADIEARKLMDTSKSIQEKLIDAFGAVSYINGALNRQYLAHLVFNDKEKLKIINGIIHPEVTKHFSNWLKEQNAPYCIQENAIIFENKKEDEFDFIISVTAPLDVRINRVMLRDNTTKEQVLARINNQWDDEKKNKLSDFVIENINLSETKMQVKSIHKNLLKISKNSSIS